VVEHIATDCEIEGSNPASHSKVPLWKKEWKRVNSVMAHGSSEVVEHMTTNCETEVQILPLISWP
jgi:hypothetical protein